MEIASKPNVVGGISVNMARLLDRAKQRIHQEDGTRADERPTGGEDGWHFKFFDFWDRYP